MTAKVWPIDKLSNEIREGDLVQLKLDEPYALFYISRVEGASVINGGPEGNFPVNGQIELVLKFAIPFAPDQRQMYKALVVKQPKLEDRTGIQ
jgi:hypothetical protein